MRLYTRKANNVFTVAQIDPWDCGYIDMDCGRQFDLVVCIKLIKKQIDIIFNGLVLAGFCLLLAGFSGVGGGENPENRPCVERVRKERAARQGYKLPTRSSFRKAERSRSAAECGGGPCVQADLIVYNMSVLIPSAFPQFLLASSLGKGSRVSPDRRPL
ncbi:MAG: hypothetical protein ACRERX_11175 [Pseudomonas sp.]